MKSLGQGAGKHDGHGTATPGPKESQFRSKAGGHPGEVCYVGDRGPGNREDAEQRQPHVFRKRGLCQLTGWRKRVAARSLRAHKTRQRLYSSL